MPAGLPAMPTAPAAPANGAPSGRSGEAVAVAAAGAHGTGTSGERGHGGCFPVDQRGDAFSLLLDAPLASPAATTLPAVAREAADEVPDNETAATVLPGQLLAMLGLAIAPVAEAAPPSGAASTPVTAAPTPAPPQHGAQAAQAATGNTPALPLQPATAPPLAVAASSPAAVDATAFAALMAMAPSGNDAAPAPEPTTRADAIAALASTPPAATTDTLRAAPPTTLPSTLAQPAEPGAGYGDEFGANLAWMAERRLGHAEIRLNPEHLGPIDVRLQLDGERVHAEFHSAHAEVRHALEASLPRLRDLLGQHGLQLAQADVGQRRGEGQQSPVPGGVEQRDAEEDSLAPLQGRVHRARGLLDEYA